jgi:hypothetical protein
MSRSWLFVLAILSVLVGCGKKEGPAKIVEIDGVRHILNPAVPLTGSFHRDVPKEDGTLAHLACFTVR